MSVGLLCLKTRSHTSIVPNTDEVQNTAGLVGLQHPSVNGVVLYLQGIELTSQLILQGLCVPMWSSG